MWDRRIEAAAAKLLTFCGEDLRLVVSRYSYFDAEGQFLFEVLRYSPKGFDIRVPIRWMWVDIMRGEPKEVQTVLYRLPEVLVALEVLIVEGEKIAKRSVPWDWLQPATAVEAAAAIRIT
jgi:hypothetical protein